MAYLLTSFILTAGIAVIIPLAFNYNMAGIIIISSISRFIQFIIVPLAVITFYFGKSKEDILNANKNVITDVIIPIIGLFLTILLLVKFNWAQQFSTKLDDGTTTLNIKAVVSMVIRICNSSNMPKNIYEREKVNIYFINNKNL